MTTDDGFTSFDNPDPAMRPISITRGPEDNLWFTIAPGSVWRVNRAGTMLQITLDTEETGFGYGITAAADATAWSRSTDLAAAVNSARQGGPAGTV